MDRRRDAGRAATYVAGILGGSGRNLRSNQTTGRSIAALMQFRLPRPLACAIALATVIALRGSSPPTLPDGARADDRKSDRIAGVIGGPLVRTEHGVGAPLHTTRTTVWLWYAQPVAPGQRVIATGRLRTPRGAIAPGSIDRAALVASRGADWEMTAQHIEIVGEDNGVTSRVWRWADATQREWHARVCDNASAGQCDAAAAALSGIITGDRAGVPEELDQRWRAVGIYHVLSVSGLHLAVVAGLAFALLCKLLAASPLGSRIRPARWAAPIAIVLAIAYTLITGAQLATLRALVVIAIVLAGKMFERPVRLVDALGVAAIAILVWRPQDLYDPSFQLSFVAALTLALRPAAPYPAYRLSRWLWRGLATSAWVALTTAPITAYHFHQVAIGGVVGNLVLTPLLELVALPLGLAGVIVGAEPLVTLATWIVGLVDWLAQLLAHGTPVATIAVASPLVMAALVVLGVVLASRAHRTRIDLVAWFALCVMWTLARTPPVLGTLRVTFLDVGQGDAAIVELPDGAVWLVDAGGIASARNMLAGSAPGRTVARALQAYGHDTIDLAIVSHPHPDHYLGFVALADTIAIRELWAIDDDRGGTFAAIAHRLAARGTRITHPPLGTWRSASGVELEVWAPRYLAGDGALELLAADPVRSVNDNSLVVAVRFAGRTVLFAGDLEIEGEDALVAAGIGEVDVVKVAHHGSRTSSSPDFIAQTRPELAVISCGVANAFGFPAPSVVARWRAAGARVLRTDEQGTITVSVDADGTLLVR